MAKYKTEELQGVDVAGHYCDMCKQKGTNGCRRCLMMIKKPTHFKKRK